jgi:GNAT superfamily N-acetyltransferase
LQTVTGLTELDAIIRPFQPADLNALHAISLATGHLGGDAAHLYADPDMIGHIYSAPYAVLEPALALVVADDDGVAGFAVGTARTSDWEERLERQWWPDLRRRYSDPADIVAAAQTPDQRRAFMIHHPERSPAEVTAGYPAHLHLNLLPRAQRRGVGAKLFRAWLDAAEPYGVTAVHVAVNRANAGAVRFWQKQGFEAIEIASQPETRTLWMGRA